MSGPLKPRRIGGLGLAVAAIAFALGGTAHAGDSSLEFKVKAAFLYNFARFVTWPAEKFSARARPLEICLLEHDPLGPVLRDTLAGKTVEGHAIEVRELSGSGGWQGCHLAWLDSAPVDEVRPLLRGLEAYSVLSVHEAPAAQPDGVIRLFLDDGKLRFEVNDSAAQRANLRLSSRLMSLASVVHVDPGP